MGFEKLIEPIKIRGLEFKNRVIFPAIKTKLAEDDGSINQKLIDFHLERVKGGAALNILEATDISQYSRAENQLLIKDDNIDGFKRFVNDIHNAGGKAGIQLWHGWVPLSENQRLDKLFASYYKKEEKEFEELKLEDIEEIIDLYGKAAKKSKEAGFDVVEINAAYGNTLHSFLSPGFNKRTDEYGGSRENRLKLLIQVIEEVRNNISEDMVLILSIVAKDDYLENGLEVEDIIDLLPSIEDLEIDILNITRGNVQTDGKKYVVPPIDIELGFNLNNTKRIKENTSLLISATGRINDPYQVENILNNEISDFVCIGRGLLADPYFCNKILNNKEDSIIKCRACNQGCYGSLEDKIMPHITCSINPMVCRESEYRLIRTSNPQKVAVIGGGVGGIVASLILDKRGHEVVLFEELDQLGGKVRLASKIPGKEEFRNSLDIRIKEIKKSDIELRLNTEFIDKMVEKENFDSVIIATGAAAKALDIPGNNLDNVYIFSDILKKDIKLNGKIVVIGGGFAGLGMAELLAEDEKNEVIIIEEKKKVGMDLDDFRRITTLEKLGMYDVKIKTSAKPVEVKEDRLIYEYKGKKKFIKMDAVVMAVGYSANKSNNIKQYCQDREIPFYVIGDALIPRRVLDAVSEAANIAINEIV